MHAFGPEVKTLFNPAWPFSMCQRDFKRKYFFRTLAVFGVQLYPRGFVFRRGCATLRGVLVTFSACLRHMLLSQECGPFATSVLSSPFLCVKNRISVHLLNLAPNCIHVNVFSSGCTKFKGVLVTFSALLCHRNFVLFQQLS